MEGARSGEGGCFALLLGVCNKEGQWWGVRETVRLSFGGIDTGIESWKVLFSLIHVLCLCVSKWIWVYIYEQCWWGGVPRDDNPSGRPRAGFPVMPCPRHTDLSSGALIQPPPPKDSREARRLMRAAARRCGPATRDGLCAALAGLAHSSGVCVGWSVGFNAGVLQGFVRREVGIMDEA